MNVTALPATRLSAEQVSALPAVTDPQPGDTVGIYSRGAWRVAVVTKVGRTNLTAEYTTEGAWTTAQNIYENYAAPVNVARITRSCAETYGKNFDYAVTSSKRETIQHIAYCSEEEIARRIEKAQAIVAEGREGYIARITADEIAARQELHDKALAGGPAQYVHVTSKAVKIADAVLIERAAS
jgi:hypothetical protein